MIFEKSLTFAAGASFVSAQPSNVNPSLVGVGAVTLPFLTSTLVMSLPSVNVPWFASNVTVTSSE